MQRKAFFGLVVLLSICTLANAAELRVPTQYPTIQDAVNAAQPGDQVVLMPTTYSGPGNVNIDFGGKAITVRALFPNPASTTINCGGAGRAFLFENGEGVDSVVEGLTIIEGKEFYGGAIECFGSSPTIRNCVFQGNEAAFGGAIDVLQGSPQVVNCVFRANRAITVDGDESGWGAAVALDKSVDAQFINCLFVENSAARFGSVYTYDATASMVNCTVVDNTGLDGVGGVYCDASSGTLVISNSILWNNGVDTFGAQVLYSCTSDATVGEGVINVDPMFRKGPAGDYYLSQTAAGQIADSPCLDAGDPAFDYASFALDTRCTRTDNGFDADVVDMGYHYAPAAQVLTHELTTSVVPMLDGQPHGTLAPESGTYLKYSEVQLYAEPEFGYKVDQWSGTDNDNIETNSNVVTILEDTTVTVQFREHPIVTLTAEIAKGEGTVEPQTQQYLLGDYAVVHAEPAEGYRVGRWIGTGNDDAFLGQADAMVLMDGDKTVQVEFVDADKVVLRCNVVGGNGTIRPRRGIYDLGDAGAAMVELTATPDVGYKVKRWTNTDLDILGNGPLGPVYNTETTNTVTFQYDTDVTVEFEPAPAHILTTEVWSPSGGMGGGTISWSVGDQDYSTTTIVQGTVYELQVIELHAEPDEGYEVAGWYGTDDDSIVDPNNTITIGDEDARVVVEFRPIGEGRQFFEEGEGPVVLRNNGTTVSSHDTIQAAIDAITGFEIEDNFEVIVGDGEFSGDGNVNIDLGGRHIVVRTLNGPDFTTIVCGPDERAFYFHSGEPETAIVRGFTVVGGNADLGGAVYIVGASQPTIENCVFDSCFSTGGGGAVYFDGPAVADVVDWTPVDPNEPTDPNEPGDDDDEPADDDDDQEDELPVARLVGCRILNCASEGPGGGIFIDTASPVILSCEILSCAAGMGAQPQHGGGIYATGGSAPAIINCLVAMNQATNYGSIYLNDSPALIRLCTVADNVGMEIIEDNRYRMIGGIVSAGDDSNDPEINHCIIWGNGQGLRGCEASFTCTEGGAGGSDNIFVNPRFTVGRLGRYYLSQTRSGQQVQSPCINAGEDILGDLQNDYGLSSEITTAIMGLYDVQDTDLGYHYPIVEGPGLVYKVRLHIADNGYGEMGELVYDAYDFVDFDRSSSGAVSLDSSVLLYLSPGSQISLVAMPDNGYRVQMWEGTDDDSLFTRLNSVTVTGDTEVWLYLEPRLPRYWHIPGDFSYTQMQAAIDHAKDGDFIILHPGHYAGVGWSVVGKDITISSVSPNDPDTVLSTFFDFSHSTGVTAYIIGSGYGQCVLNGITIDGARTQQDYRVPTPDGAGNPGPSGSEYFGAGLVVDGDHLIANCVIQNCQINGYHGGNGNGGEEANDEHGPINGGRGGDGSNVGGAGMLIGSSYIGLIDYDFPIFTGGGSPTVMNCIVRNCVARAGDGGNGGGAADGTRAGDAGVPGRVFGGGVYVAAGTNPTFIDCQIVNNEANGGLGGNGGDATGAQHGRPGWGGLTDDLDYVALYDDPDDFTDYDAGDPRQYSAFGGGVYVGGWGWSDARTGRDYYYDPFDPFGDDYDLRPETNVRFVRCEIAGNVVRGAVSGQGGQSSSGQMLPEMNYQVPAYGGGVYCAEDARAVFEECLITGNIAEANTELLNSTPEPFPLPIVDNLGNSVYVGYLGYGGGFAFQGSQVVSPSAKFVNCHIAENQGAVGGGGYAIRTRTEIADSNFVENTAHIGGGMFLLESEDTVLARLRIEENLAQGMQVDVPDVDPTLTVRLDSGTGGGLYAFSCNALIQDCMITGNTATSSGGGIFIGGHPDAIAPARAIPVIENCLIADNMAAREGGGAVMSWQTEPILTNCTIADNTVAGAEGLGGGILFSHGSHGLMSDSIIWDNSGMHGGQIAVTNGAYYSLPSSLEIKYSDVQYTETVEIVDEDPTPGDASIREGFDTYSLMRNDDMSSQQVYIGFPVNFFGTVYDSLFVNNNGNITFQFPMAAFTPFGLTNATGIPVIAPFFADVDTRAPGSDVVTWAYGRGSVNGRDAFGVSWLDVGYFALHDDKLNSFQLIIIDRSDRAPGDFDIEFNYGSIQWETGDASFRFLPNGDIDIPINGFGGESARAGYSAGTGLEGTFYEFEGSGVNGYFLDSSETGLIHGRRNSNVLGRYVFRVTGGIPEIPGVDIYVTEESTLFGWDPNDAEWDEGTNNFNADPLFVGGYYLSQEAAGQGLTSPCVDAGSVLAQEYGLIDPYTTRTDGTGEDPDSVVDLGFHYQTAVEPYHLVLTVVGEEHGTVEILPPVATWNEETGSYLVPRDTALTLRAIPDPGHRVKNWEGLDDESPVVWNQTEVQIVVESDRQVVITFEPDVVRTLVVPDVYDTIEEALSVASNGDTIVLAPGTYFIQNPNGLDFEGRNLTLTSTDPDDPQTIADTIIDCQGSRYVSKRAFHFHSGEDRRSRIMGITIKNGWNAGAVGGLDFLVDPDTLLWPLGHNDAIPRGYPGEDVFGIGYGGAIFCENGSSPVFENCVIEDCTASGGVGGDGQDGVTWTDGHSQSGGQAGDGNGNGYGGAIACVEFSNPLLRNITFRNNVARGGLGGFGGNAGPTEDNGREGWGGSGGGGYGFGRGGAIFADMGSTPVIENCDFINNAATNSEGGLGGAMATGASWGSDYTATPGADGVTVSNGIVAGGAIFYGYQAAADITGSRFEDNQAYEAFQRVRFRVSAVETEEIPTYENTRGGAIFSDPNNTLDLTDCEFRNNLGGAIFASRQSTVHIDGCLFENNGNEGPLSYDDIYQRYYNYYFGFYDYYYSTGVTGVPSDVPAGALYVGPDSQGVTVSDTAFRGNYTYADGGAVNCKGDAVFTDCSFGGNRAQGYGGAFNGYQNLDPDEPRIQLQFERCSFLDNEASLGGGLYLRAADVLFDACYLLDNEAEKGGGLVLADGDGQILGGMIKRNRATGLYAVGGGVDCAGSSLRVENCYVEENVADGKGAVGGGIHFFGADALITQVIKNSLFRANTATAGGGAVGCTSFIQANINNATFVDNAAGEFGGAVFADWSSFPKIRNSIFAGNSGGAVFEEQIGGDSAVTYTLFHNNPQGNLVDAETGVVYNAAGEINSLPNNEGNLVADPMFESGPLGAYYLNVDSLAVDGGGVTAAEAGLADRTTRTDSMPDGGPVDMGFHYANVNELGTVTLTTSVVGGHGQVLPLSGTYYTGQVVELTAIPDATYTVDFWGGGTMNDGSEKTTNMVVMDRDKHVTVQFKQPRILVVGSTSKYTTIQRALEDAQDGDVVMIEAGEYRPVYPYDTLSFLNKDITLTSFNPDDPECVAETVLYGYDFSIGNATEASTIAGLTIQLGRVDLINSDLTIRNVHFVDCRWFGANGISPPAGDGGNGVSVYGGAIEMYNSSPRILNCRFENCSVTGGDGGRGGDGNSGHADGYDGGWAGRGYGGAVYAGFKSRPYFLDCEFINCFAQGGNGGDGGNANPMPAYGGRGGSWLWSPLLEESTFFWWDGWEYGDRYERYGYYSLTGLGTFYEWELWSKWFGLEEYDSWDEWINQFWGGSLGTYTPDPYAGAYDDYWRYSGYGGAVFGEFNSELTFEGCTFEDNHSYGGLSGVGGNGINSPWPDREINIDNGGGAIFLTRGSHASLTDCVLQENSADPSTAYDPDGDGEEPAIDTFDDFYVSFGGGLGATDDSSIDFTHTAFEGNQSAVGGGFYIDTGSAEVVDCNFVSNSAYHGAGLYVSNITGSMTDSYVARNLASLNPEAQADPGDPEADPDDVDAPEQFDVPALPHQVRFGHGAGLYCLSSVFDVSDTVFTSNKAYGSGGGIFYLGADADIAMAPKLENTLLYENSAGRDGGGVSTNWYARPTISNTTIADNLVSGAAGEGPGYGGGLYASYGSAVDVINSIIWDNVAVEGSQIAVGSGDPYGPNVSKVVITHSDIGPAYDPNDFDDFNRLLQDSQKVVTPPRSLGQATLVDADTIQGQFTAGEPRVHVVVSLQQPDALRKAVDWRSDKSVEMFRAEVARRQDAVLQSLNPTDYTLTHRYTNYAGFAARMSQGAVNQVLNHPMVTFIEPVLYAEPMLAQAIPLANALQARELYDGTGIAIAIVDQGIDYRHERLGGGVFPNDKVIGGYDTGNDDADPLPFGDEAHGTACAGVAAGDLGTVGDYIGGVAYGAKLYSLKMNVDGQAGFATASAIAAWDWCLTHQYDDPENPIMVVSNSWGMYGFPIDDPVIGDAISPAMTNLAALLVEQGMTILAASGNDGFAGEGISWPSAMSNVISVGAVYDTTDEVTNYSNTADILDVLAPADPMYTCDIIGAAGYDPGDYTPYFNGTSSACPFAAGCVASIQSAALEKLDRYLTPGEVRSLLSNTGVPITDTKVPITKPRVNLGLAIANLVPRPIYVEEGCILQGWDPLTGEWAPETFNIAEDPLFVGEYFLSEVQSGQLEDSPCVDAGSDDAVQFGLDAYTTRSDSAFDSGLVNLGYHHVLFEPEMYVLRTNVHAYGLDTLYGYEPQITPRDPEGIELPYLSQVQVEIVPEPPFGYEIIWTGTDDDTLATTTNIVTMDSNRAVLAEFQKVAFELTTEVVVDPDMLPGFTASITPPSGLFNPMEVVEVRVTPPPAGYQVHWEGADDENEVGPVNTVTLITDTTVTASYEPVEVTYYAVAVGINDYPGVGADLQFAARDASQVYYKLLNRPEWKAENMHLLLDTGATKSAISGAIQDVAQRMDHDDVFVFYFAGQGTTDNDIFPIDELDEMDEFLFAAGFETIRDDEMADWINALPTRKYVVLLDTGFYASAPQGLFSPRGLGVDAPKTGDGFAIDLVYHTQTLPDGTLYTSDPNGLGAVISAADATQNAWEFEELRHGIFTYHLLHALDGKADIFGNADQWVTGEECYNYVAANLGGWLNDIDEMGLLPAQFEQDVQLYDGLVAVDRAFVSAAAGQDDPATYYVPADVATLRDAVSLAKDGDVIVLAANSYDGGGIIIDKEITITSTNPEDPEVVNATIINCEGYLSGGVYFTSHSGSGAVLSGVTIQNGNWTAAPPEPGEYDGRSLGGGGIVVGYKAAPTIKNCVIRGFTLVGGSGVLGSAPDGADGGFAAGAGILCAAESSPTIVNTTITDCHVVGGNATDGLPADDQFAGGRGGWGGGGRGGGVYVAPYARPTFRHCTISDCTATGGNGGNGGDYAVVNGVNVPGGYGGLWSSSEVAPWQAWGYEGDYYMYSGLGGGVYCEAYSEATFEDCIVQANSTRGGISGIGGAMPPNYDRQPPVIAYELPSFGGGVYCAAQSKSEFVKCQILDNVAPQPSDVYTLDSSLGHGGGIAFEDTAAIRFEECKVQGNLASVGGGIYSYKDDPQIVDCNFLDNRAYSGGGLYAQGGAAILDGCWFEGNYAYPGDDAAVIDDGTGQPTDDDDQPADDDDQPADDDDVPADDDDQQVIITIPTDISCQGGGIYAAAGSIEIRNTRILNNYAVTSGGGLFMTGADIERPTVFNCLIADNIAGRDGGGASINWYADPMIGNCTFANNTANGLFGVTPADGVAGGLYTGYHSRVDMIDTIFWGNSAQFGRQVVVGSGFEFDPRPSTVAVSYSAVQGTGAGTSEPHTIVEDDCTWIWTNNLPSQNPMFIAGPLGNYYLEQAAANEPGAPVQENSPYIDAGSTTAASLGLDKYTTRNDPGFDTFDRGVVDLGYHYPLGREIDQCRYCDLPSDGRDGVVKFEDFAELASNWLASCSQGNGWCSGSDSNFDGEVNFFDMIFFASCWLVEDLQAPLPDPAQWADVNMAGETFDGTPASVPNTLNIAMSAEPATDNWGWPVAYQFECIEASGAGVTLHKSPWLYFPDGVLPTWVDQGLTDGVQYTYVTRTGEIRVPGPLGNYYSNLSNPAGTTIQPQHIGLVTADSVADSDRAGADTQAPAPVEWELAPTGLNATSIQMTAAEATDMHPPVLYEFIRYTDAAGTVPDPAFTPVQTEQRTFVDTGLQTGVQYTYRFRVRDNENYANWSDLSDPASAVPMIPDNVAPTPNPSLWAADGGAPRLVFNNLDGNWYHVMRAEVAADNITPADQIEYQFVCTTDGSFTSPWLSTADPADARVSPFDPTGTVVLPSNTWIIMTDGGGEFAEEQWRVHTRDAAAVPNVSGLSVEYRSTADGPELVTPQTP